MAALPPLNALQALDRIERRGSAQAAADALNVTPSAISHRLRTLEAALGFPVTTADGRGVALTPRARRYLAEVRPALAALEGASRRAGAADVAGPLRISAPPGLAAAWLAPRLTALRRALPGVALTLVSGQDSAADISIDFAPEAPKGAAELIRPDFFPVASARVATAGGGLRTPASLRGTTLLHLYDHSDWRAWASAAGASASLVEDGARNGGAIVFQDANLLLAAAIAGQGVALGDAITCERELAEGRLLAPFDARIPSGRAYWLRVAPGAPQAATSFAEWLQAELGVAARAPDAKTGALSEPSRRTT